MDSNSIESCIPPGFRFHPTDEELVGYYLKKKVVAQKIDLDVIREVDLYRIEPWDLREQCRIGYEEQNEWYFFSYKDKKYPTGTRTNRATLAGFWKATGRDKAIHDKHKLVGMRKTLVFYKGRAPNGQKTDWIMHEYRLESDENGATQEEGWVVCRAFKKRANVQPRTAVDDGLWDSTDYFKQQPKTLFCKQETDHLIEGMSFLHSPLFVHLPQLESPSLPSPAKPRIPVIISAAEASANSEIEEDLRTDWRTLDKFVASQLSQEVERPTTEAEYVLIQGGGGKEDNLEELLLSSCSDCDVNGICMFDK